MLFIFYFSTGMYSVEWISRNDNFWEFDEELLNLKGQISEELWNLKDDILEDKSKYENFDIYINWKSIWIPDDFIINFIKELQKIYNIDEIKSDWLINDDVKKMVLWDQNIDIEEITNGLALVIMYIKKLTGNDFMKVLNCFFSTVFIAEDQASTTIINKNFKDLNSVQFAFFDIIKKYWDKSSIYLDFFFSKKENYILDSESDIDPFTWTSSVIARWMITNFFEIFWNEPEVPNLLDFLYEYPQTLENLWWKEVKSIELSMRKWYNFCFKWIIEMVKSRSDLGFPHLWNSPTDNDKMERKKNWEKIIREYELMIRNYISKDYYIDGNGNKQEKQKETTFWKIFFSCPIGDDVLQEYNVSKENLQKYSKQEIADYSFNENKYGHDNNGEYIITEQWITEEWRKKLWQQMLNDIEVYSREHPDEDILVYVQHHWNPDWSSGNWWTKEDWGKLANISPKIKILSCRCYFWTAYENKDIYNQLSSVSWFSNESATNWRINNAINWSLEKWVWFHELEILSRLNYNLSTSSLTESMEYTNWSTWETEIWKIGLAQNDSNWDDELNNYS